jgi:phospholipid/cholesterol/gamma-HCH transport system permease protein
MYLTARRAAAELDLTLQGEWRIAELEAITSELDGLELQGVHRVSVDAAQAQLDLSGAWLLREFIRRMHTAGVAVQFQGEEPATVTLVERTLKGECPPAAAPSAWFDTIERLPEHAVEGIGRRTVHVLKDVAGGLAFFGRTVAVLFQGLARPRRLRPTSVARHIYETGITAVPIVSLIAFLISVILAYMGAQELRQFGAEVFVVDLVTIGVLRELGVLLTAIIVAGRSGSAFAAELGSMQLNEEVDALRAMGVNPIELLVLPRVIGLVIALPLLALVADIIGLAGGALLCHSLLGMPLPQYLYRVQYSIAPTTFWVGVVKAPVFGVLIALSGCYCGMLVRGSSRELGRLTTVAVVGAIFFVILADALFAVLFQQLDL